MREQGVQREQGGQGECMKVRQRRPHTVVNKSFMWYARRGKGLGEKETLSSFFFMEFPYSFDAKEMFEVFNEYGLVVEVVIPPRRDKRGKKNGLIRFRKVVDE